MHCTRAPNFRPNHNISAFFIHFIFQRIVLLTWSKTSQEKSELILALVLWVFFFFMNSICSNSTTTTPFIQCIGIACVFCLRALWPQMSVAAASATQRHSHYQQWVMKQNCDYFLMCFPNYFFFCCGCCCCCRCCRCRCHLVKLCCRSDSTIHNAKTNAGKQAAAAK